MAEFVGTLILVCAGAATAIVNQKTQGSETLIGLAASSGLAVMIIILSTGHISGAHLNPSVTIAFAALRHFPWTQVRNNFKNYDLQTTLSKTLTKFTSICVSLCVTIFLI